MRHSETRTFRIVLIAWATLAILAVASDVFSRLPALAVQGAIAFEMLVFFCVLAISSRARRFLFSLNLKRLTWFHVWRVLPGAAFLYLHYVRHQLPWNFAVPGGYGDIVVGLTAWPASLLPAGNWKGRWTALLGWQVLGFLDLAGVVRAALLNGLRDPQSMRPLTQFPLSFLPAMLVALTFMAHIVAVVQIVRKLRERSNKQLAVSN
jgi:hypothetical protein